MKKGAKYRAYVYLFQFMKKVKRIKVKVKLNRDAYLIVQTHGNSPTLECIQHCPHCKCDPKVLWAPQEDHSYADCLRRAEIQNGTHFVTQLHLCAKGSCYTVCTDFF